MPEPHTLAVFAVAAFVFAAVPGPSMLYVVTRSLTQGRTAGLASAGAIGVGELIHVGAAAIGLSALLASSATAFTVVKYLGAAYLVFLGVRTLLDRGGAEPGAVVRRQPLARIFGEGVVVSVFNPKTALFFLAFLPQFVDPARGSVAGQLLVLGTLQVLISLAVDSTSALLSGTLGTWVRGRMRPSDGRPSRLATAGRWATGGTYVALGLVAAFVDPKPASAAGR